MYVVLLVGKLHLDDEVHDGLGRPMPARNMQEGVSDAAVAR